MNNLSLGKVQVQQQNQALKARQQAPISFRASQEGDKADSFENLKSDPDQKTIKAGIAAVLTVIGLYLAKSADKIEKFVKSSQKSSNKFVKAMGVVAGLALSILSILGASSLFKEKVEKAQSEVNEEKAPEAEPPADADATEKPDTKDKE